MFGCFPLCAFVDGLQCGIIIFFAGLLLLVCAFVLVSFWFHPSAVYYLLDSGCYFAQKMKTSCWYCSERFFSVRFHSVQFEVFFFVLLLFILLLVCADEYIKLRRGAFRNGSCVVLWATAAARGIRLGFHKWERCFGC